jgi:predicted phosphodiesterase
MKKLVALAALSAFLVFSACVTTLGAEPFERGPYSGAPSASSVVISWVVSPSLPARLEVSPIDAEAPQTAFPRVLDVAAPGEDADGQVDVVVDGLAPATAYVYRVMVQSGSEIATSPIGHFETAPAPDETVTFAVLSDTQWQWEGTNRLAVIGDAVAFDATRSGGFDFILHAGDLVETPNAAYWEPWFDSFETMLLAAPFVPVLGNHEKNSVSYYKAFAHPPGAGQGDERWWTLHWGDVVVVGLDTSVSRADRILEQQAYARAELSGPERWKFVIFHHPIYSSDAYHGSGYGYELIYHPIFVEAGVNVVFNGHAHNYERIEKDGIVYLVLGGGGAVPRELAPTRVEGSIVAIENHNFYARVAATKDSVSVDIVSVAEATETTFTPTLGELLDSFVLAASAQPAASPTAESRVPLETQSASATLAWTVATQTEPEAALEQIPHEQAPQGLVPQEQAPQELVPQEPATEGQATSMPTLAGILALLALLAIAAWAILRAGR